MKGGKLTIFANFRINDDERLQRMQDSFRSFAAVEANRWIVNARGRHKENALSFLREALGERLSGHVLESGRGWLDDSRHLVEELSTDYCLVWIEDHCYQNRVDLLGQIVGEMAQADSDYLSHSWWFDGHLRAAFADVQKQEFEHSESFELTEDIARRVSLLGRRPYLISLAGVFSRRLFVKLLSASPPLLRRWPRETPFELEKGPDEVSWLPLRVSLAREELFASIDDDNGMPGYCLQARGLYPRRETRLPVGVGATRSLWRALARPVPVSVKHFFVRVGYSLF